MEQEELLDTLNLKVYILPSHVVSSSCLVSLPFLLVSFCPGFISSCPVFSHLVIYTFHSSLSRLVLYCLISS